MKYYGPALNESQPEIINQNYQFFLGIQGLFCFVQNFFSDNTRVSIFIFFCRAKREHFFQNSTLGYMTKTVNQIFFFPPPKSEYFFQQHWESEYFFRKKP